MIWITYVNVTGTGSHGCNRRSGNRQVRLVKRPWGSLEGDVFIPSVVGTMEEVDEGA